MGAAVPSPHAAATAVSPPSRPLPILFSPWPLLLPTPPDLPPLLSPLPDTVPLPVRGTLACRAKQPSSNQASSKGRRRLLSRGGRRSAASTINNRAPAVHAPRNELAWALLELLPTDSHPLPVGGWTSLASPGLIFHDLVLTSFYYDSPAAPSFSSIGAAPFWIAYKGPLRRVSCSLVKNALNFSFSAPPSHFVVLPTGPNIFKAAAKN